VKIERAFVICKAMRNFKNLRLYKQTGIEVDLERSNSGIWI